MKSKRILNWISIAFFILLALVYFPSISSLLGIIAAVLMGFADNEIVKDIVKSALADDKMVAAICAAPALALAENGFVCGKNITCYPAQAFIDAVNKCANYTGKDVEVDGNIITANGPRSAFAFSKAICDFLGVTAKF